jgi:hypothetical protein
MAEQRLFYNVNIILYLSSVLEGSLSNTMMRLYIGKARIYNWRTAVGHAIPGCVLISLLALLFLTLESEISFKYTPLIITLVFLRIIYKVIFGLNWSNSFNLRDRYLEALLYFLAGLIIFLTKASVLMMIAIEVLLVGTLVILIFDNKKIKTCDTNIIGKNRISNSAIYNQAFGSALMSSMLPLIMIGAGYVNNFGANSYAIPLRYSQMLSLFSLAFYQPYLQSILKKYVEKKLTLYILLKSLKFMLLYFGFIAFSLQLIGQLDFPEAFKPYLAGMHLLFPFFLLMAVEKILGVILMLFQVSIKNIYWYYSVFYIVSALIGFSLTDDIKYSLIICGSLLLLSLLMFRKNISNNR